MNEIVERRDDDEYDDIRPTHVIDARRDVCVIYDPTDDDGTPWLQSDQHYKTGDWR